MLRRMLKERSLVVMELDQWDVDVRSSSGSDGCPLFLSRTAWKDIMSPHPLWWKWSRLLRRECSRSSADNANVMWLYKLNGCKLYKIVTTMPNENYCDPKYVVLFEWGRVW